MQDNTNWEIIRPIENSSNDTSFFYKYYGLYAYFNQCDDGKTIKIDMIKSLLTDKFYQARIYNYVDDWFIYFAGTHDSINYNEFIMIFSVIAKKPIRCQKIEKMPFLLKVLGELIKDGWSKAAW
ncbi:MAG: hypothetical protein RCO49_07450 [Rickettsia endosymbiont of Argas persicus]